MTSKPGNERYSLRRGWLTETWQVMHPLIWSFKVQEIGKDVVILFVRGIVHPRIMIEYQIVLETAILEQTENKDKGLIMVKLKLVRSSMARIKGHITYLVAFASGLKKSYQYAIMIRL